MPDAKNKRRNTDENGDRVKRRRKRRRKRGIISFLFIILILLCVGLIIIKTPLFNVEKVTVKGNVLVSEEDIFKVSGIYEGQNIFDHLSSYYEEKIHTLPYVSTVKVQKKFPSEIYITVSEEYEYAVLDFGGVGVFCDKHGKSIKIATMEETEKLIKFTGCHEGTYELGNYIRLESDKETETFKKCLAAIEEYGFLDVTEVNMADINDLVFTVDGNLTVKIGELGDEDELSYKMAYIKEVIDSLPHGISGIIDATNPEAGVSYRTGEYEYTPSAEEATEEIMEEVAEEGVESIEETENTAGE